MKLHVEQWPLTKLLRYANNSRDHSEAQVAQIAASITEFGFVNPCLIDAKGVLIAGHGRVSAAQKLKIKSVPVIKLGHLTETQARALRIADNSIAQNASWNADALRIELAELKVQNYPLKLLGFEDVQLVSFMANPNPAAPGEFQAVGDDISTEHSCPKCGYRWSGKVDAAGPAKGK